MLCNDLLGCILSSPQGPPRSLCQICPCSQARQGSAHHDSLLFASKGREKYCSYGSPSSKPPGILNQNLYLKSSLQTHSILPRYCDTPYAWTYQLCLQLFQEFRSSRWAQPASEHRTHFTRVMAVHERFVHCGICHLTFWKRDICSFLPSIVFMSANPTLFAGSRANEFPVL